MRLLIVEDEREIVASLQRSLQKRYVVDVAFTSADGVYQAGVNSYDVIILDLGLPDVDGLETCRTLRTQGVKSPVLILTGRDESQDKVEALDSGADDYLTKPFHLAELEARLRALMRRSPDPLPITLAVGDLQLDVVRRRVRRGEHEIVLRRKEFDLLEYLMRNQGRPVSREMILEHVWHSEDGMWTNAVDVHVKHLRDRIDRPFDSQLIKTVHGVGYKIEAAMPPLIVGHNHH